MKKAAAVLLTLLALVPSLFAQTSPAQTSAAQKAETVTIVDKERKAEVGVLLSYTRLDVGFVPVHNIGLGGRFVYNFDRNFALDTEYVWGGNLDEVFNFNQVGGHFHAVFAGLKVGPRWERVGLFAKVRPGFTTSTHVYKAINAAPGIPTTITYRARTDPALDFGGVVEYYPDLTSRWRNWLWRTDVGATQVFYRNGPTFSGFVGSPGFTLPGETKIHFHIKTGVNWRF